MKFGVIVDIHTRTNRLDFGAHRWDKVGATSR